MGGYDMKVTQAWELGYSGRNVVVTILDDGVQPDHPDLKANFVRINFLNCPPMTRFAFFRIHARVRT